MCLWCVYTVSNSLSPPGSHVMAHSPPSSGQVTNLSQQQQLPPACGARQLSKLKRFLTTLQQFGADISPGIGDHVRALVLALVVRTSGARFSQNLRKNLGKT